MVPPLCWPDSSGRRSISSALAAVGQVDDYGRYGGHAATLARDWSVRILKALSDYIAPG
ncbi:hypothetical protein [Streptomyces sp. NPDC048419]|uniref:hypothetical protein n=1 Tax=Streptomyces sp. NPDC048419 TaxID=3365547 RepID=UPI003715CC81